MHKKILIIEDETTLADMYKFKLEKNGYKVLLAPDGVTGINIARTEQPDLVLLDIIMPGIDGFEVLRELRSYTTTENLIIFIFSNLGQKDEIEKGIQEGANDYLIKTDLTPSQLLEKVNKTLSANHKNSKTSNIFNTKLNFNNLKIKVDTDAKKVLLIEDNNDIIEMYDLYLNKAGLNTDISRNGAWGLKLAREKKYDLIIMDMMMPAMNGLEMLKNIKGESINQDTPIIVLSNSAQEKEIIDAKKFGATCYLLKSQTTPAILVKEITKYLK
jgi:DNA-binding response OmpR family regulator